MFRVLDGEMGNIASAKYYFQRLSAISVCR